MSTRNKISTKNPYWVEKFRYLELQYFCRQYPIWKKAYASLHGLSGRPKDLELFKKKGGYSDPTARCAEAMVYYSSRIELVERIAQKNFSRAWKLYFRGGLQQGFLTIY